MSDNERDFPLVHDILRRRRRRALTRGGLLLIGLIGVSAAAWLGLRSPEPAIPAVAAPPLAAMPAPAPIPPAPVQLVLETPPVAALPPVFIVPPLSASDPVVRDLAGGIAAESQLADWLEADGLIRRFVVAVASVAEGRSPRNQLAPAWPEESFEVQPADEEYMLTDPASYVRYDVVTEVFVSADTENSILLYRKLEPLFNEAYAELGYPDTPFSEALEAAIHELLATPVLVGEPTLQRRVLTWEYVDPELEALSPAQKQLLRMGPTNAPRVQRKLRAFGRSLGMPPDTMPATQIHDLASRPVTPRVVATGR
jgi:hypothetical protein